MANPGSKLRADAAENRRRLIEAARLVVAESGIEEIARRAEVGIATLYCRFPTRDDLIAATFEEKMCEYAEAVEQALVDPDPWSGFCDSLERICATQAKDQGLRDVLTMTFPTANALEQQRNQALRDLDLIRRAQDRLDKLFEHQISRGQTSSSWPTTRPPLASLRRTRRTNMTRCQRRCGCSSTA